MYDHKKDFDKAKEDALFLARNLATMVEKFEPIGISGADVGDMNRIKKLLRETTATFKLYWG